jgi:hypothetical protein
MHIEHRLQQSPHIFTHVCWLVDIRTIRKQEQRFHENTSVDWSTRVPCFATFSQSPKESSHRPAILRGAVPYVRLTQRNMQISADQRKGFVPLVWLVEPPCDAVLF